MKSREQLAKEAHELNVMRMGGRRAKKTDVITDIVLIGGPPQFVRWYQCKIGSKTFSVDRPDRIPGWDAFTNGGTGHRMRRFMYKVREIEGMPFYVGDFVEMDKW